VTPPRVEVLTTPVLPISVDEAGSVIAAWSAGGGARVVCAANVHMVMEAWDDASFAAGLAAADLVVCDGRPLVWACWLEGARDARQARGLDVMLEVCRLAARRGLKVGLYGAEPAVAAEVRRRLGAELPDLEIVYSWSPPFRELSTAEDEAAVRDIRAAGVQLLFVSLGCPRQERWMLAHRERLACVMIGVGAAFDMLAGFAGVAPRWMQRAGLEWVYRFAQEPRRLWRRYALHNGRFVALVVGRRFGAHGARAGRSGA
jgi:N-acetylglucosaminyldiphosphoundecaprenol N-acetyl-beta-D-mannosaminyltransferase